MNRKIIAIIIVVIVMIGLVYFMFLSPIGDDVTSPVTVVEQEPTLPDISQAVIEQPVVQRRVVERKTTGEDELKKISASFVERYGTYSNQSGYNNIKDLDVFMSKTMQVWASKYIDQALQNNSDTSIYYGITTKSVVVETVQFASNAIRASFTVQTQRVEAIGTRNNERSFQQTASVEMVKENGIWKVDRVVWEE